MNEYTSCTPCSRDKNENTLVVVVVVVAFINILDSLLCASWGDIRGSFSCCCCCCCSTVIGTICSVRSRSRSHIGQVQTVRVAAGVRSRGAAAVAAVLVALAARAAATVVIDACGCNMHKNYFFHLTRLHNHYKNIHTNCATFPETRILQRVGRARHSARVSPQWAALCRRKSRLLVDLTYAHIPHRFQSHNV